MSCQNWGSNSVKPRGEIYWQFLCTYSPKTSRNCLPTLLTTSDRYPTSWNSGEYTICTEQYIDFESSYFIISTFFKIHYCSDNSDAHSLLQSSTTSKLLNNITEKVAGYHLLRVLNQRPLTCTSHPPAAQCYDTAHTCDEAHCGETIAVSELWWRAGGCCP